MSNSITSEAIISNLSFLKAIIAIDGLSSCGKSTLARDLAKCLGYIFIDSGAMYRAVSLLFIRNEMVANIDEDYSDFLNRNATIEFKKVGDQNKIYLNGENVDLQIRKPEVAKIVSHVASNSSIRKYLVKEQKKLGSQKGIVMDGRDIGTVVFPNAEFKFFVTAEINERTARRHKELLENGMEVPFEEVKKNLAERDSIDSSREDSPLIKAKDAIVLDTTKHTRESQLSYALELLNQARSTKP